MTQDRDEKEMNELGPQMAAIFRKVPSASEFQASPFLKTRVLAELREKQSRKANVRIWKVLAACTSALAVALVSTTLFVSKKYYDAVVGQQMALQLSGDQNLQQVAFVQVDLPAGVNFYSKSYPDLASLHSLTLPWSPAMQGGKGSLPIVIESTDAGVRTVNVHYLDSEGHPVLNRALNIKFRDAQSATTEGRKI